MIVAFEHLTPLFPNEKFDITSRQSSTSTRIIDLFSPIGKGQRGLLVAQPKTGKTTLMKEVANAIAANHPEAYMITSHRRTSGRGNRHVTQRKCGGCSFYV